MPVYYSVLAGLSFAGALLCWRRRSRLKDGIFILAAFIALAGLSAVRYDVGVDYSFIYGPFYGNTFLSDPEGISIFGTRFEPGFIVLCKIIAFFSKNYQMFFVVTSVLNVGLILLYFWIYSPNVYISVFLFITLSQYYCSMNFLRQTIAAAIALYAFPFLKKRGIIGVAGYFAVILLAASFHKSALILIVFFFINLIPVNKYTVAGFAGAGAVLYLNTEKIIGFVTKYWYSGYGLENRHMKSSFEFHFAIAAAAVFLLVFLCSRKLLDQDKNNYVYVNYAFFYFFFVLLGTKHSILDRFGLYFELALPVAVAIILHGAAKIPVHDEGKLVNSWEYSRRSIAVFSVILAVVFGGSLAIHHYALYTDYHGVDPYDTVYNQPFYAAYAESLKSSAADEPSVSEPGTADMDIIEEPEDNPSGFIKSEPPPSSTADPAASEPSPAPEGDGGGESPQDGGVEQKDIPAGMPVEVTLEQFLSSQ